MWTKLKKNMEFRYALVCIVFSALFLLWLIPAYTPSSTITGDLSSAALPNAMMSIIFLCGIVMLIKSFFAAGAAKESTAEAGDAKDRQEEADLGHVPWRRLLLVLACVLAYLLALNGIGFYLTTLFVLPLTVRYYNRSLSWRKILLSSAVLLVFIYVLFEAVLSVKMPRGIFF